MMSKKEIVFSEKHSPMAEFEVVIEEGTLKRASALGRNGETAETSEGQDFDKLIFIFVLEGMMYNDVSNLKKIHDVLSDGQAKDTIKELQAEMFQKLSF